MEKTSEIPAITAPMLASKLIRREPLFILDVRNEEDFGDWKIEGGRFEILNIPYFELIDGVEEIVDKLPQDGDVLVVCAKEGSSVFVAEQLAAQGMCRVSYLAGGMKAWNEHVEPVKIGDLSDGGAIYQFVRLGKGCLSYMIVSRSEAAVIDPLRMTGVFEQFALEQGAVIKHAIDTHLHADHISGGRLLAERTGANYWLPPKDAGEVGFQYHSLEEGATLTVGAATIRIQPVYSPGHTIGSTSLIVDGRYLLSGDSLFVKSIGRPDLAGQAEDWVHDLRQTLYDRFKRLPEELVVLPAHFGTPSELGNHGEVCVPLGVLYRHNPGLNIAGEAEFRRAVTEQLPPQPRAYEQIRMVNMGKLTPNEDEQRDMELGPNRCAVHDHYQGG